MLNTFSLQALNISNLQKVHCVLCIGQYCVLFKLSPFPWQYMFFPSHLTLAENATIHILNGGESSSSIPQ